MIDLVFSHQDMVCIVTKRLGFSSFEYVSNKGKSGKTSKAHLNVVKILGRNLKEAKIMFPELLLELEELEKYAM